MFQFLSLHTVNVYYISFNRTFDEKVESILNKEATWEVCIVRRHLLRTAIEQLEEAETGDWKKKITVTFVGEEGIDTGGLYREFYSLLVKKSPVFENKTFSLNSTLLQNNQYKLMGKITAHAICMGHPGPKNLHEAVVSYVLTENMQVENIPTETISNAEVLSAIEQVKHHTACISTDIPYLT